MGGAQRPGDRPPVEAVGAASGLVPSLPMMAAGAGFLVPTLVVVYFWLAGLAHLLTPRHILAAGTVAVAFGAAQLKEAVDLDSVRGDLASVVEKALEPAHISVWVSRRSLSRSPVQALGPFRPVALRRWVIHLRARRSLLSCATSLLVTSRPRMGGSFMVLTIRWSPL